MADRDGHELHLAPHVLEGVDKWGVLGGLFALPLVATEVTAEDDLADEKVAILPVEIGRVRHGTIRDSPGVDEVGGGSMSLGEEAVQYFAGEDPLGDASGSGRALLVAVYAVLFVAGILRDVHVSAVLSNTDFGGEREWGEGVGAFSVLWFSYLRGRREPILRVILQLMWCRMDERGELLRRGLGLCPGIRHNESEISCTIECSAAFGGIAYRRMN